LILYLDTSVLVAAHTAEPRTAEVQAWLQRKKSQTLAISDWVVAEFSAALAKKQRIGEIDAAYRAHALGEFRRVVLTATEALEVRRATFHLAARFAEDYATGLRAGDALHLAIASEHGALLHTLDERLAAAGPRLGVQTVRL
jgi:uncharacterized protein